MFESGSHYRQRPCWCSSPTSARALRPTNVISTSPSQDLADLTHIYETINPFYYLICRRNLQTTPLLVFFTNKRTHVVTYKHHQVFVAHLDFLVSRRQPRVILVWDDVENANIFRCDLSVDTRLSKCVGLLVKNTNKGEPAGLKNKGE